MRWIRQKGLQQSSAITDGLINTILSEFNQIVSQMLIQSKSDVQQVINTLKLVNQTLTGVQRINQDAPVNGSAQIIDFFPQYEQKINTVEQFWNDQNKARFFINIWIREYFQMVQAGAAANLL